MNLFPPFLIFLGGGLGAVLRYGLSAALRGISLQFPWSILLVNLAGCFAMGVLAGVLGRVEVSNPEAWRAFIGVGVLGGFTTFSAFSLDAVMLWERGETAAAAAYVLASVAGSIMALMFGLQTIRWLS